MIFGQLPWLRCLLSDVNLILPAICLHRDVKHHKLIFLLIYLCLGISLICNTNALLIFVLFFMKIRNLEGHHNIVRNDIKLQARSQDFWVGGRFRPKAGPFFHFCFGSRQNSRVVQGNASPQFFLI